MVTSLDGAATFMDFLVWLFWFHLPAAIDALIDGELSLAEVGPFLAYLFRIQISQSQVYDFSADQSPYLPADA